MPTVLALAHPVFAVAAGAAIVLMLWALLRHLLKMALFFAVVGAVLWIVFFAG